MAEGGGGASGDDRGGDGGGGGHGGGGGGNGGGDQSGGPRAELRVASAGDGRWTWQYVEPDTGVVLHSNETFASREAAEDWARRAYPDLELAEEAED
jgi:hypothetical protein